MNETGPGDYDVPEITGKQSILAENKNGPRFSFGMRSKKMQFISKEYLKVSSFFLHSQNFLGKETEEADFRTIDLEKIKHSV